MKEQKRKRELESSKTQPKLSETYTHYNRSLDTCRWKSNSQPYIKHVVLGRYSHYCCVEKSKQ